MAAEFPFASVNAAYPIPLYYEMLPEEFVVGKTIYDDNGADYKLQHGGSGLKRFLLRYDGLLAADTAILDAHLTSCFYSEGEGSAYGFNFRHHIAGEAWTSTNGTLYANVHYKTYRKDHSKVWICSREIELEQRP